MMREVRQDQLVELLRHSGPASVQELSRALSSSPATIRRDLEELASHGAVERTWGGARVPMVEDDLFTEASLDQADAKRALAELAAREIPEGATVTIDIGTTAHYVACLLRERSLTVVTPSLPVFELFRDAPSVQVVLLGGEYSPRYQCLQGPLTVETAARFSADIALIGCSGITDRGQVRDTSGAQAAAKRVLAANATRRLLLADSTKFPGRGGEVALELDQIDLLVTDSRPPAAVLAACTENLTKVVHP